MDIRWDEYYAMATGKHNPGRKKSAKWRNNIHVPFVQSAVDLILPRLISRSPLATVAARREIDKPNSESLDALIKYQWDLAGMDLKIIDWAWDALVYGTAPIKVGWSTQLSNEKERLGRPTVEVIDPQDFYIDPVATSEDDARFIVHRFFATKEELLENKAYDKKAIQALDKNASNDSQESRSGRLNTQGLSSTPSNKKIEVIEYWGKLDILGKTQEAVATVANGEQILRAVKNPFDDGKKPFVVLRFKPNPHFFYGIGLVEGMIGLQKELDETRNQRMDNRELALNVITRINRTSNVNLETLETFPGAVWIADTNDAIEPVIIPDFGAQLEQHEQSIKRDLQTSSGMNDVVTGGDATGGVASNTATGAQLAAESTALRFRIQSLLIDAAVRRLGNMFISRNQQLMVSDTLVRILGEGAPMFKKVTPEDIKGRFDYIVEVGSMLPTSKIIEQQQALNLYALFREDPEVDVLKLKQMIFRSYDINPEAILRPAQAEQADQGGQGNGSVQRMISEMSPQQIKTYMDTLSPEDSAVLQQSIREQSVSEQQVGQATENA